MRGPNSIAKWERDIARGRYKWFAWFPVESSKEWHWLEWVWVERGTISNYYYPLELFEE